MKFITLPRVLLVLFLALIVFLGFLLLAPVEPLKINGVTINGSDFKAGGTMAFTIDRCKNVSSAVPGTATRYFVDVNDPTQAEIFISSTDDLGEKGCAVVKRTMDIPAHIKDGTYKLKFVTRYYPSVLREPVKVEYTTQQSFKVKGQEVSVQLQNIYDQLKNIQGSIGIINKNDTQSLSNAAPVVTTPGDPNDEPVQNITSNTDNSTTNNTNVDNAAQEKQSGIIQSTLELVNGLLNPRK